MDAPIITPCPNCGEEISVEPGSVEASSNDLACPNCGEKLVIAEENKVLLAHPLPFYQDAKDKLTPDQVLQKRLAEAETLRQIERRRRLASDQSIAQRISQQKTEGARTLKLSLIVMSIGVVLLVISIGRVLFFGGGVTGVILSALIVFGLLPFGIYFFVWSTGMRRSLQDYEEQVHSELAALAEEEEEDSVG